MKNAAKPVLKIIQMAAFQSNIGDNANLSGTRRLLQDEFSEFELQFTNLELSDFSWGLSLYNDDLLAQIQSHDLFIIGGGGFLEIIPGTENWTGTRINIPEYFLQQIKLPIIFYALGIDTVRADLSQQPYDREISKLKTFIDFVVDNPNMLLSTRHDGSMSIIESLLGSDYARHFTLIGDGGFFTTYKEFQHSELRPDTINIAINFGGDLLDARFADVEPLEAIRKYLAYRQKPTDYETIHYSDNAGFNRFIVEFANTCRHIIQQYEKVNFIFVPHIYRDIEMGFYLISELGFPYARRNITMAPYLSGEAGKDYIVDLYRQCDLVIGMRFHANLCPIAMSTPSIGLISFPMVRHLYQSLKLDDRLLDPASSHFEDDFFNMVQSSLQDPDTICARYQQQIEELEVITRRFIKKIRKLIKR